MNCPVQNSDSIEILLDYCAAKLPAGQAAEFERHLKICPECQAFAQSQQKVWTALDVWEEEPVSAGFDAKLYQQIQRTDQRPSWRQWLSDRMTWKPALAAAGAAVAVVLLVQAPAQRVPQAPPQIAPAVVVNSRVETIEPDQIERALDDLEMLNQISSAAKTL